MADRTRIEWTDTTWNPTVGALPGEGFGAPDRCSREAVGGDTLFR